jgi:hypothetical protein
MAAYRYDFSVPMGKQFWEGADKGKTRQKRVGARLARISAHLHGGRLFHRRAHCAAPQVKIRIIPLAIRQGPTPLKKPPGRSRPRRRPMS